MKKCEGRDTNDLNLKVNKGNACHKERRKGALSVQINMIFSNVQFRQRIYKICLSNNRSLTELDSSNQRGTGRIIMFFFRPFLRVFHSSIKP